MKNKLLITITVFSLSYSNIAYSEWPCVVKNLNCKAIRLSDLNRFIVVDYTLNDEIMSKTIKVPQNTDEQLLCYRLLNSLNEFDDSFDLCQNQDVE